MIETAVESALQAFPLARPSVVRRFEGFRNEIWLVEDGGARYVLRRNLQHRNAERIAFQVRFQQHLLRQRFPTSDVVETRSGGPFAVDGEGVPWVLFTYVEGEEFDFARPAQVLEAARRLAEFHTVAASFTEPAVLVAYQRPYREWWSGAEENLAALEEMYAEAGVDDELAFLREFWRGLLAEWPLERVDALTQGWVYGDYHGRNMVFAGDELRGLFDFDDIERGPLIYDVSQGVQKFGREGRGSLTIREEVACEFVAAYARERPLSVEERAALPMLVAMNFPPDVRYHRYCRDERGENIVARLRREVASMRRLGEEMVRIGPALRDA